MVYLVCPGSERSGLTSANTASDLATMLQRDILSRQACSCAAMVPSMPAGAVAVTTTFRSWEATGVLVQMEKLAQCRGRTRPGPTPVRFATALRSSTGRSSRLVVCAVCSRVSSLCLLCFLLSFLFPVYFGRVFAVGTCIAVGVACRSLRHGMVLVGAIMGLVVNFVTCSVIVRVVVSVPWLTVVVGASCCGCVIAV